MTAPAFPDEPARTPMTAHALPDEPPTSAPAVPEVVLRAVTVLVLLAAVVLAAVAAPAGMQPAMILGVAGLAGWAVWKPDAPAGLLLLALLAAWWLLLGTPELVSSAAFGLVLVGVHSLLGLLAGTPPRGRVTVRALRAFLVRFTGVAGLAVLAVGACYLLLDRTWSGVALSAVWLPVGLAGVAGVTAWFLSTFVGRRR